MDSVESIDRSAATVESLVNSAAKGDKAAFGELVGRYATLVMGVSYAVTGDRDAACDLAQDTFYEAYRNLKRLRVFTKFSCWLITIARRRSVSWVRTKVRSKLEFVGASLERKGHNLDPSTTAESVETNGRVLDAIRGLPLHYREAIVLRFMDGRRLPEICSCLGISRSALEKRLYRAKAFLREVLGDLNPCVRPEEQISRTQAVSCV